MGFGIRMAVCSAVLLLILAYPSAAAEKGDPSMVGAKITVHTDRVIGTINPNIYGHFTEHIGGCIYDGIWVGKDSKVPNIDGIRKDLVEWMKRISPPVIRWPGGCFADKYHWMDGIGPADQRPKRYGRWSDVTEPNTFGTHEFIRFCRLVGAEPYLAANVGTGTAEEFQSWVEYCNAPPGKTTLADLREKNGSKEPFDVKYWGVGNESWGCGGSFTPEDYCTEYRKFTTWLPAYGKPLYLIGCGPSSNDVNWTKRFFVKYRDYFATQINGWAPHYYCGTAGTALEFSDDQWYELLARAYEMEKLVIDQWNALTEKDPHHDIKLIVDEWGAWHPSGTEINKAHLFEQMSTLRDAEVAALTLDIFNRNCDKVAMSCVAQLVSNLQSLFLADGRQFVATPNFYVYEMYKVHQGATGVQIEIASPIEDYRVGDQARTFAGLLGSASVSGKKMHISVVNTDVHRGIETEIDLGGVKATGGKQTVLTAGDIHAHNTFDKPNEVVSVSSPLAVSGSTFKHTFPPASITMLELDI